MSQNEELNKLNLYPKAYLNFLDDWECERFGDWDFLPADSVGEAISQLKSMYPERVLVPFAEKKNKKEMACFENGKKVIVVDSQTLSMLKPDAVLDDVWAWMHFVVEEIRMDCDSVEDCGSCPYYEALQDHKTGEQYQGIKYPVAYTCLLERHLIDFGIWFLLPENRIQGKKAGLESRYNRKLIPFAERNDNDDVACFECFEGSKVKIIHDWASRGWEQREMLDDFWAWLHFTVDETKMITDDDLPE